MYYLGIVHRRGRGKNAAKILLSLEIKKMGKFFLPRGNSTRIFLISYTRGVTPTKKFLLIFIAKAIAGDCACVTVARA